MYRLIVAAVCFLMLLVAGCSGRTRHDIITDEDGTLAGLTLTPEPQSLRIDTDSDFYLDWGPGYPPPRVFQVELDEVNPDGTTDPVLTEIRTLTTGHYRLSPTFTLYTQTFLLLEVRGAGQTVRAMYLTGGLRSERPRAAEGSGKAEHTVTTR